MKQPLERCIQVIKNAPDFLIEQQGIILDFSNRDGEARMLNSIREEFRIKAQWLEFYLLERIELQPELTFTWKKDFKPLAEMALAYYHLAQEVYAHHLFTQRMRDQVVSPGVWMALCELQTCKSILQNSGYICSANLTGPGKAELYHQATQHYDALLPDDGKCALAKQALVPPIQALEGEAVAIAQRDVKFQHRYLAAYIKTQKRCYRSFYKSPFKNLILRADGAVHVMGRGQDNRSLKKLQEKSRKKSRKEFFEL